MYFNTFYVCDLLKILLNYKKNKRLQFLEMKVANKLLSNEIECDHTFFIKNEILCSDSKGSLGGADLSHFAATVLDNLDFPRVGWV